MQLATYIFDGMTVLYAISVLLYFLDFLNSDARVNRAAFIVLCVVWGLQTFFLAFRTRELGHFPVWSTSESMVVFAWVLLAVSVVVNYFYKIDLFTFFANLIGFAVVALDTFAHRGPSASVPQEGDLLLMHVGMAFLSYTAFSLACIFSVMFLIQERLLKAKRFTATFRRLPALDRLDRLAYRMVLIGFPLLLISMILGAIWTVLQYGRPLLWDAKPLVSLLLLLLYGAVIYLRVTSRWPVRRAAWLTVAGFGGVVLNYLVVGMYFSQFHRW